jgi:hypothetical protein
MIFKWPKGFTLQIMVLKKVQIDWFVILINRHVHLIKNQRLEWHMYVLIDQFNYSGLFD